MGETEKKRRGLRYAAAFLLPLILTVLVFAAMGFTPFGDNTILTGDLNGIDIPIYADFQRAVQSGESLFYTFSKHLGGSLFSAHRFFSFPELLYLVADVSLYPLVAQATLLLYVAFSGLSCFYALCYFNKSCRRSFVLLSTGYAMMNYMFAYSQITYWMKFLVLLPVLLVLADRYIEKGKWLLYTAALWLTVNSFYYIAYMVCLFIAIFFFFRISLSESYITSKTKGRFLLKKTAGMAGASLLAVAGSAFYLWPAVVSAGEKKGGLFSGAGLDLTTNYSLLELPSKLGIGSFAWDNIVDGLPLIHCGTAATVLVLFFFLSRNITRREKTATAAVFAVLLLSTWLRPLDLFWHGSYAPTWFPYRYVFVWCFFSVYVAARGLSAVEGIGKRRLAAVLGALFVLGAAGYFFSENLPSVNRTAATLLLFASYAAGFFLLFAGENTLSSMKKAVSGALVVVLAAEMVLNAYFTLSVFGYYPNSEYRQFITDHQQILASIDAQDSGFYRLDKNYNRTLNDPLLLGYYGVSHFSSYVDDTHALAEKLGYENYAASNLYGAGSTAFADAYLSVRYLLSDEQAESRVGAHFVLYSDDMAYAVYKNEYTLPFAFAAPEAVTQVNMDAENTFQLQQEMLRAFASGNETYFVRCGAQTAYDYDDPAKYADYTFEAPVDGWYYAILRSENADGLYMLVNDIHYLGTYPTDQYKGVINLGYFETGENVTLSCIAYGEAAYITDAVFYALDKEKFSAAVDGIAEHALQDAVIENGYVAGTVEARAGEILSTTLLYSEGWQVTVNGQPAETVELFGCMLGVPLEEGTNEVEMRYTIVGMRTGTMISCIALVVYGAFVGFYLRKKKEKPALAEQSTGEP